MEALMGKLEALKTWKQTMRKTCRRNKLSIQIVSYFTPIRFKALLPHFVELHEKKSQNKCQRWLQNQLKAFYWVCVAVSCVEDKKILEFEEPQWNILFQIFFFKNRMTVTYEAKKLVSESKSQRSWTKQEEKLFVELMKQLPSYRRNEDESSNRWNQKARQLYEKSNGEFLRSGKQIREKWLNHLDPSKNHGQWSQEEQRQMVESILRDGRRWSRIAKEIQTNRTEHMIKNRYKTIIGRLKKKYPKIKDQDILLKKSLQNNTSTVEQTQMGKIQAEAPPSALDLSQNNSVDLREIEGYLEEDKEERQEDHEQSEEKNDKVNVGSFRNSSGIDLHQVYSPWMVGIPSTPVYSPSVGYFLNLSNFSSVDNVYSGHFYNPEKHQ